MAVVVLTTRASGTVASTQASTSESPWAGQGGPQLVPLEATPSWSPSSSPSGPSLASIVANFSSNLQQVHHVGALGGCGMCPPPSPPTHTFVRTHLLGDSPGPTQ